jgi:hypothetical protein
MLTMSSQVKAYSQDVEFQKQEAEDLMLKT